jgi:hypothetical protein
MSDKWNPSNPSLEERRQRERASHLTPKQQGLVAMAIIVAMIAAAVGFYLLVESNFTFANTGGTMHVDFDKSGAQTACEMFVKERLKAPSTADIQSSSVSESAGSFNVSGTVDAQNSYGAKIRSSFRCTVIDDHAGRWLLQSISIE